MKGKNTILVILKIFLLTSACTMHEDERNVTDAYQLEKNKDITNSINKTIDALRQEKNMTSLKVKNSCSNCKKQIEVMPKLLSCCGFAICDSCCDILKEKRRCPACAKDTYEAMEPGLLENLSSLNGYMRNTSYIDDNILYKHSLLFSFLNKQYDNPLLGDLSKFCFELYKNFLISKYFRYQSTPDDIYYKLMESTTDLDLKYGIATLAANKEFSHHIAKRVKKV